MKLFISLVLIFFCDYNLAFDRIICALQPKKKSAYIAMQNEKDEKHRFKENLDRINIDPCLYKKCVADQCEDIKTANLLIQDLLHQIHWHVLNYIPQLFDPVYDKQLLLQQLNLFRDNTVFQDIYMPQCDPDPLLYGYSKMQYIKSREFYFCILTNYLKGKLLCENTMHMLLQLFTENAIQNPPVCGLQLIENWERAGNVLEFYGEQLYQQNISPVTKKKLIELRNAIPLSGNIAYDKILNYWLWWNITYFEPNHTYQNLVNLQKAALAVNESWDNIFYHIPIKYRIYVDFGRISDLLMMRSIILRRYIHYKTDSNKYNTEIHTNVLNLLNVSYIDYEEMDIEVSNGFSYCYTKNKVLTNMSRLWYLPDTSPCFCTGIFECF